MGWFVNECPKWVAMVLWLASNVVVAVLFFLKYSSPAEYFYLRHLIGVSLPLARASAAVLNLNCALILLPVCRNLLSLLRGSCARCPKVVRRTLDKNLTFHKLCAYMIILATGVHYWSHTNNFERFLRAHEDDGLKMALTGLVNSPNPIRSSDTNPMLELVQTWAGVTGIVITLSLIVIYSSATAVIRRSYFEVFWYTHHLFAVFFIALCVHGSGGLVKSQSNLDEHDPEACFHQHELWNKIHQCPYPEFKSGSPKTWMWVVGPVFLYICERCVRFFRSQQRVVITKAVKHPSKVIELQMRKKDFKMQAGQYIFLHCPSISHLEWHPFTLTSAPQETYFSVHIRTVGDWTNKLLQLCSEGEDFKTTADLPRVAVDGPFGTASEDVFDYQVDMLVAAGIGVTPFAAVIKDIWYRYLDPSYHMKLQRIYFYWICPDTNAFEWFADLLKEMERQMIQADRREFADFNIYLTRGWDRTMAANIAARAEDIYDAVTGLRSKTFYGRPNWDEEFQRVAQENPESKVGVFFCGPKVLSDQLNTMCNKHSKNKSATFFFNKENF